MIPRPPPPGFGPYGFEGPPQGECCETKEIDGVNGFIIIIISTMTTMTTGGPWCTMTSR